MYDFIKNLIAAGGYRLEAMEKTIERHFVRGDLTDAQRVELLQLAADNADESKEINVLDILADLEQRVSRLESAGVVVWTSGHITAKGETVLYDILKEGKLRYLRYDGGRASTTLAPGKINGWVVLDSAGGAVTHTVEKDAEGNIILVPVENPVD